MQYQGKAVYCSLQALEKNYIFDVLEIEFLLSMNITFLRWMCSFVVPLNRDPPLCKYSAVYFLFCLTVYFKLDLEESPLLMEGRL